MARSRINRKIFGEVRIFRGGGRVTLQDGVDGRVGHALGRANYSAREFRGDDSPFASSSTIALINQAGLRAD